MRGARALRRRAAATVLLPAAFVLAACGGRVGAPDVDGLTLTGDDVEGFQLVEGTRVSVSFSGEQVSANAGCNTMFGHATWDGEVLKLPEIAMTEMGCAPELQEQDDVLVGILSTHPTVTHEGTTLTIAAETGEVLHLEQVLDAELTGTEWRLDGIEENSAVSSLPAGVAASLTIEGGQAQIDFGCNTGGGAVEVDDTTLRFSDLAVTLKACDEAIEEVEAHMIAVLTGTVEYEIDGPRLRVRAGEQALHFRAAPEQ